MNWWMSLIATATRGDGTLGEIVASAELRPGAVVLDVGTGTGVLIPLIQSFQPSTVLACDVAEKMLQRVHDKYS